MKELRKEDYVVFLFPTQSEDAEGPEVSDVEAVEVMEGAEEEDGSDTMV
jgi:hypothetical protein